MTVFVAAIDPGQTTGVAIMSSKVLIDAWQDGELASMQRLIQWYRQNREAVGCVFIEDTFLGKGAHASLRVARSSGFCEGALAIAGYPQERIEWFSANEWRAELGINKGNKVREDKERAARALAKTVSGREFTVAETHMAEAICMSQVAWSRFARKLNMPMWRNR